MRFGVEYTFIPKNPDLHEYHHLICLRDEIKKQHRRFSRIYVDGGSGGEHLEIPSPPHRNIREAEFFYKDMMRHVKRLDLTARLVVETKDTEEWYGTGGGHVHVELPKAGPLRRATIYNLICMVANRPWLGWVFNEYMDDENASALWKSKDVQSFMKGNLQTPQQHLDFGAARRDIVESQLSGMISGAWAINFRKWNDGKEMTVEMRFFDAPRSWEQAKEHIEFALAMVRYAVNKAKEGNAEGKVVDSQADFNGFKLREWTEKDFKYTCEILGLKWEKYEKYMENFDLRKEHGRMV